MAYQIIKSHAPSASSKVLATVNTEEEAKRLRNKYVATVTPQEIQAGYLIQIVPTHN
jgi:hypothetical protein